MNKYDKTIIKFKFKKPMAFSLPPIGELNLGNFYPYAINRWERVANINKMVPKMYYNLDYEFEVVLLSEIPREDIISEFEDDPEVVRAYRVDQANAAATNHRLNNIIRDRLRDLQDQGVIVVISDSFMDYKREMKAQRAAAKNIGKEAEKAAVAVETLATEVKKRGRPTKKKKPPEKG